MKEYECDVVFLIPGRQFTQNFILSWSKTLSYLHDNNISYLYNIFYAPIVTSVRNALLGLCPIDTDDTNSDPYVKPFNNQVKCKKVIFIDSDMVWKPEAIQKLIDSPYDVTFAPYVLSDNKTLSIKVDDKFVKRDNYKHKNKAFEIQAGGLGLMACKLEVLQNIPYPWFALKDYIEEFDNGIQRGAIVGEDVYFCQKLIDFGYKLHCDPTIEVGHEKQNIWKI
jgi:hypothetical protein